MDKFFIFILLFEMIALFVSIGVFISVRKMKELFITQKQDSENLFGRMKELFNLLEKKKEELQLEIFFPYIAMIKEDAPVLDNSFKETGEILAKNTFYTIIFEKDEKGLLLNGEKWISLNKVIKNPSKKPTIIATKTKVSTSVYNGPGQGYLKLGTIQGNTPVEIIETFNYWKKIRVSSGKEGYVWHEDLM